jgi:hypothetical protein
MDRAGAMDRAALARRHRLVDLDVELAEVGGDAPQPQARPRSPSPSGRR